MRWYCYLRKGIVYTPITVRMEPRAGYLEIEPVAIIPVSDTSGLRQAFQRVIAHGNPSMPQPGRANFPKPFLHKIAGARSMAAFERETLTWGVHCGDEAPQILGYRRRSDGKGWEEDPDQIVALPPGSSVDDVCDRMIAILQAAA